jgi:hypothetical protein
LKEKGGGNVGWKCYRRGAKLKKKNKKVKGTDIDIDIIPIDYRDWNKYNVCA